MVSKKSFRLMDKLSPTLYFSQRSLFHLIMTFALFLIIASSCSQNRVDQSNEKVDATATKIDHADSVTLIISKDGVTKARLKTKEFVQNDGALPPYLDMKKGLFVEFFDDSMNVESTLSAKTARFYPKESNILVKDSVVVVTRGGDSLKTQELVWNNKQQKFFSDKPVQIIKEGSVSAGTGMEANKDLSWIRIYQQRGTVPVEKGQLPE